MRLVIKGGRLIDPASNTDGLYNVYVMAGRVASIKPAASDSTFIEAGATGLTVIDATGLVVTPGFIDLHVHLREPGYEYKETVLTGANAAAAGGFTAVACMANTKPVNDNASVTRYILKKAEEAPVRVLPIGAVTVGLEGERLSEMADLKEAGCVAFSDDGKTITNPAVMRRALEYTKALSMPVVSHSEEPALAASGVMNEGPVSTLLGLGGIPNAAEEAIVARDLSLAALTGGRLHVAHVSTAGAVSLIRDAKARGVRVTAEATPHHLTLTDEAVMGYNTDMKMSPPLRGREDVEALRAGLKDGTIDAIATDHAPHSVMEKDVEFDRAANGVVGLETAFAAAFTLVGEGVLTLNELIAAFTVKPARAFGLGLGMGELKVGGQADITLIDLSKDWMVEREDLRSKSRNTPFAGVTFNGKAVVTIVGGKVVFDARGGAN